MTDDTQSLADGLRRHDPELLDRLIERYQQRLYRYLLFLTGNTALAEDLFQETWILVLERGQQYNAKSRFESWLFAIARNLVIDVSRRKKIASLEQLGDSESGQPFDPADEQSVSPLQLLGSRENQQTVQLSLLKIPPYYREVLLLRFHEELSLEEISAVLATPISTVKSRLYRGLTALNSALPGGAARTKTRTSAPGSSLRSFWSRGSPPPTRPGSTPICSSVTPAPAKQLRPVNF